MRESSNLPAPNDNEHLSQEDATDFQSYPRSKKSYHLSRMKRLVVKTYWQEMVKFAAGFLAFIGTTNFLTGKSIASMAFAGKCFFLAFAVFSFRLFIDFAWYVDSTNRELLCGWSFLGFVKLWKICRFSDIEFIGIQTRNCNYDEKTLLETTEKEWQYSVVLKIRNGPAQKISEDFRALQSARSLARDVARDTSAPFLKPKKRQTTLAESSGELTYQPLSSFWSGCALFGKPHIYDIAFLIAMAVFAYIFGEYKG